MSRSIHSTRKSIKAVAAREVKKKSSMEAAQASLQKVATELRRKWAIKKSVKSERKRPKTPFIGKTIGNIAIEVLDTGPHVYYPALPDDIRAVLNALPDAATEGISRIRLSLGREYIEETNDEESPTRDPFTRRLSIERFPGVYCGTILGTYKLEQGVIDLHAYVFDSNCLPIPQPVCEFYLRLHALKTLVHEVAHYHDELNRTRRGRWLMDRKENNEWYAEKMEQQWTLEIVVPYLARAYPTQAQQLREWVGQKGGILLPLESFAGDCRTTERDGLVRLVYSIGHAFESWLGELPQCSTVNQSRLAFAEEIHYADAYDECLTVLDDILREEPNNVGALACKADTLVHLERFDEALSVADQVLRLDPVNSDAWDSRARVLELRNDWAALLENANAWEAAGPPARKTLGKIMLNRAVAYCALGNDSEMDACLKAHLATKQFGSGDSAEKHCIFIHRLILSRAGKLSE